MYRKKKREKKTYKQICGRWNEKLNGGNEKERIKIQKRPREAKERRSNVTEIQREPLRETKHGETAESKKMISD